MVHCGCATKPLATKYQLLYSIQKFESLVLQRRSQAEIWQIKVLISLCHCLICKITYFDLHFLHMHHEMLPGHWFVLSLFEIRSSFSVLKKDVEFQSTFVGNHDWYIKLNKTKTKQKSRKKTESGKIAGVTF